MAEEVAVEAPVAQATQEPVQEAAAEQTPAQVKSETVVAPVEAKVDPEIQALRQRAQAFDNLVQDQRFREWYSSVTNPKQSEVKKEPDLTPEQYAELQADPVKMQNFLDRRIEAKAQEMIAPALTRAQSEIEVLKRSNEIQNVANAHKDFWELDEKGLIEKTMMRYPNLSAEDAYWLAKRPGMEAEAMQKAHDTIKKKQGMVVEKPGVTTNGPKVVKVKSKTELMERAYEYAKRGEEPPEFEIEK